MSYDWVVLLIVLSLLLIAVLLSYYINRGISETGDLVCLGCGKHLENLKSYEIHARKCNKLADVIRLSYDIPTVKAEDLAYLEMKQLPDSGDWGIWNNNVNDWVRDKAGQIDSRVFKRNVKELQSQVIAASLLAHR
jgi:hypothetical protein